jgi:GrpB-like predicted nucleotidyltransferase (UPF0157 family)
MKILPYIKKDAEYLTQDPCVDVIAQSLSAFIQTANPIIRVEHIGSTSVPGCSGKGIIDLAVLYPMGSLSIARDVLDQLGFQHQGGPEPFPESRPMRVACIKYDKRLFRIHAHVIESGSSEHYELLSFRNILRTSNSLRDKYEQEKRQILNSGVCNSIEYSKVKGRFVREVLDSVQEQMPPNQALKLTE